MFPGSANIYANTEIYSQYSTSAVGFNKNSFPIGVAPGGDFGRPNGIPAYADPGSIIFWNLGGSGTLAEEAKNEAVDASYNPTPVPPSISVPYQSVLIDKISVHLTPMNVIKDVILNITLFSYSQCTKLGAFPINADVRKIQFEITDFNHSQKSIYKELDVPIIVGSNPFGNGEKMISAAWGLSKKNTTDYDSIFGTGNDSFNAINISVGLSGSYADISFNPIDISGGDVSGNSILYHGIDPWTRSSDSDISNNILTFNNEIQFDPSSNTQIIDLSGVSLSLTDFSQNFTICPANTSVVLHDVQSGDASFNGEIYYRTDGILNMDISGSNLNIKKWISNSAFNSGSRVPYLDVSFHIIEFGEHVESDLFKFYPWKYNDASNNKNLVKPITLIYGPNNKVHNYKDISFNTTLKIKHGEIKASKDKNNRVTLGINSYWRVNTSSNQWNFSGNLGSVFNPVTDVSSSKFDIIPTDQSGNLIYSDISFMNWGDGGTIARDGGASSLKGWDDGGANNQASKISHVIDNLYKLYIEVKPGGDITFHFTDCSGEPVALSGFEIATLGETIGITYQN